MSTPSHVVIERLAHDSWFGLRLWDSAAGNPVSDGITVRVFRTPVTERSVATMAVPNRSGAFVIAKLALPAVTSPPAHYLVEVVDTLDRFLSFVMPIVPADDWGFVQPACAVSVATSSPAQRLTPLPLFDTPARQAPAGAAVVRATVRDATTTIAAAFALIELQHEGRTLGRGVADERGEVAVIFAYPEPAPSQPWSPPGAPSRPQPLIDQQWPLEIAVRYRTGLSRVRTRAKQPPLVDLCDVLSQPPAAIVAASPGWSRDDTTLRYGETLVFGGADGVLVRAS